MSDVVNRMREPMVGKVTLNIGVGESGETISKAEEILRQLTAGKPVRTIAKATVPGFGVKKHQQIGCKVTVRGENAERVLKRALGAVEHIVHPSNFDGRGNFSFGVAEHIDIDGMKYDPKIGIFGMDVCVTMERPGYRVARRMRKTGCLPKNHILTKEESMKYVQEKFGVKTGE